ncbi:Voltage-gated potassium channel subunit beta [Globisporangium polare]
MGAATDTKASADTSVSASADTNATAGTSITGTTTPVKMPHRYLGGSGLLVSALALGSWSIYSDTFGINEVYEITKRAFANGINFFDNAEGYGAGQAETVLGEAVARGIAEGVWTRADLVLTTKIFLGTNPGPNNMGLSRKHIIEGTKASLKRMQLEYVDVLFCHRSEPFTPIEETVRAMNFCIKQGWTLYWGTSEWNSRDIIEACEIADRLGLARPIVDQAKYSIFDRYTVEHDYELLYSKYDYGLSIFSPMSVGILTGKYRDGVQPGTRLSHPLYKTLIPDLDARIAKAAKLQTFAEQELQCTLPQLALAWAVSNPRVSNVLVGVSSVKQLDENLGALRVLTKLTPEVRQRIDEIIEYQVELPVQDPFPLLRSKYL